MALDVINMLLKKVLLGKKSINLGIIFKGRLTYLDEDFYKINTGYPKSYLKYLEKIGVVKERARLKKLDEIMDSAGSSSLEQIDCLNEVDERVWFEEYGGGELVKEEVLEFRKRWRPYGMYLFAPDMSGFNDRLIKTGFHLMQYERKIFDKEKLKRYSMYFFEDQFFQNVAKNVFLTIKKLQTYPYSFTKLLAGDLVKDRKYIEYEKHKVDEEEIFDSAPGIEERIKELPFAFIYKMKEYKPKRFILEHLETMYSDNYVPWNKPKKIKIEVDLDLEMDLNKEEVEKQMFGLSKKAREEKALQIGQRAVLGVALDLGWQELYGHYQQVLELFAEIVYSIPGESFQELISRLEGDALEGELKKRKYKFFEKNVTEKISEENDCLLSDVVIGLTFLNRSILHLITRKEAMSEFLKLFKEKRWEFAKEIGILDEDHLKVAYFFNTVKNLGFGHTTTQAAVDYMSLNINDVADKEEMLKEGKIEVSVHFVSRLILVKIDVSKLI